MSLIKFKNIFFIILISSANNSSCMLNWFLGSEKKDMPLSEKILKNIPKESNNNIINVLENKPQTDIGININLLSSDLFNSEKLSKLYNQSRDQAIKNFESLSDWALNNKKNILIYSLGLTYIGTNLNLMYLKIKLSDPNCWSKWQQHKTLEELYQIPQNIFAQELLKDIQRVYTTISNPTDFVTPLITFMYDIDKELIQLRSYQDINNRVEYLKIRKVFYFDKDLLEKSALRLNKLIYMKNTFLAWLADFKMSQTQRDKLSKYLNTTPEQLNVQ